MIGTMNAFIVIFAISCSFRAIQAVNDIQIKEIVCDYNKERANNITCRNRVEGGKHIIDFSCTLLKEVKDVIANVQILKNDDNRMIPLVNITDDFCSFMASTSSSFYLELLMKMLRDQSNINHVCPYSGYLYATGINPDPKLIPNGIPGGEYHFDITLYEYKRENFLGHIKAITILT